MESIKWALVAVLISPASWADCPKKVSPIKRGEVAQCDGFLFTDEAEKEASQARDDVKAYKEIVRLQDINITYLKKENDTANERLQNFIVQTRELSKQVVMHEDKSEWQKFIYFAAGVAATSIIVSNVNR